MSRCAMNRRDAKERATTLTVEEIRGLILADHRPADEPARINAVLSVGYVRDLYAGLFAESSSRSWNPAGSVRDLLTATNILREFGAPSEPRSEA